MRYTLKIDQPKEFYHESHRPSHYLNFAEMEEMGGGGAADADLEDQFQ